MPDVLFRTYSFIEKDMGLVARYALDRTPESTYVNLQNLEARQENALSTRFGRVALTTNGTTNFPLGGPVHTLARLKSLNGNVYRYAAAGTALFRISGNAPGQYLQINSAHPLSGNRFSKVVYRPSFSSVPYVFFADSAAMLKDNGSFSDATPNTFLQRWGILPPVLPPTLFLGAEPITIVDSFQSSPLQVTNITGTGASTAITSATRGAPSGIGGINTTQVLGVSQIVFYVGQPISIVGMSDPSFNGNFDATSFISTAFQHQGQVHLPAASATGGTASTLISVVVNTTVPAPISQGVQVVAPVSMANIVVGTLLTVNNGLPDQESVFVTAVTGTTFTAAFALTHLGGATLMSSAFNGTIAASTIATVLNPTPLDLSKVGQIPSQFLPSVPLSSISLDVGGQTDGVNTVKIGTAGLLGGSGYVVGDVVTITGGSGDATYTVDTVNPSGKVLTGHVSAIGTSGYAPATNVATTGGHGINLHLNILTVGAGYQVGDIFTILSGSADATGQVTSITTNGIVTGIVLNSPGTNYVSGTGVPTSDSGIGQGLTVNVVSQQTSFSFLIWSAAVANISSVEVRFYVNPSFTTDYYSATLVPTATPTQILVPMVSFTQVGAAGTPGKTWADVTGYQVIITTGSSGPVDIHMSSFFLLGSGGPNSETGGALPYDYRYTYFNINTGDESNPSVPLTANNFVSPNSQPVFVTWTPSPDQQVTHVRIYRRGGTLNDGWLLVAQVPVGQTSYIDGFADNQIASNQVLEIDNDVPVTSTLPVPLNATLGTSVVQNTEDTVNINFGTGYGQVFPNQILTIGTGERQETVTVISATATTFTAFFQFQHAAGESVTANTRQNTPINLAEIAYQMAWLAGDPNNPHILYYSKAENPEAFPPENTLEIGTPDQPIMSIVFYSGQLFVFTSATVWIIFTPGASIPNPIPTSVKHGLASNWGIVRATNGQIWYQSYDGIYVCQGFGDQYASKLVEWLPRGVALGPVSPYDTSQLTNVLMEFRQNEIFVSYVNQTANYSRIDFDITYQRWRNDDVSATAMLREDDTDLLIIGRPDGMVYIDREGNFDDGGWSAGVEIINPINFALETSFLDQGFPKAEKVYQELTLDINTNGQNVSATLLFNYGTTVVPISTTINTTSRKQVQLNIQGGNGQRSLSVALQLVGSVTNNVDLFQWHIRGEVDAERRTTFDSYWQKYGTDEWKIMKQGWFEYETPGGQPIVMSVYFDGETTARFQFTLPIAPGRTTNRFRFPPWKFSTVRFIGLSAGDFKLYAESEVETKPVVHDKGYFHSKVDDRPPQEQ